MSATYVEHACGAYPPVGECSCGAPTRRGEAGRIQGRWYYCTSVECDAGTATLVIDFCSARSGNHEQAGRLHLRAPIHGTR